MVLHVTGLRKKYGSVRALEDFSLDVKKGEVWGVLGPNGSGKTTALGILLGVTLPSAGAFTWFEQKPSAASRRRIGSILEQPNFYPWLSGEKNLEIVGHIRGHINNLEIEKKLKIVGLWERRSELYAKYSLGMKQRLAFAAALLGNPEVLVLDEPTNGLDAEAIAQVRETVLAEAKAGKTILMASHILDEVEKMCTHVVILQNGKTIARGSIQDVLAAGNSFEFAAENMDLVKSALSRFSGCKNVKMNGERFLAEFDKNVTAAELNKFMFESGISLSHLSRQMHGLESQFLKLLERNRD